jgi:anti-sigma28 factor (negative regulator of flagellin synthesis)
MKRNKLNPFSKISLIKERGTPIPGVRFMQISGISTSLSIPMGKINSSQVSKPARDEAVLNFSTNSFSSMVKQAGQMPEVRSEVVDAFKARIQSGQYPSQDVIAGLTDLIGGAIVQQARSGSSS